MLEIERNLSADDESCNTLNFSQVLWKRSQGQGNVRNHSIFLSESENGYEWYFRENFARELNLINHEVEAMKSRKRKIYIKREKLSVSLVKFKNQQKNKM